MDVFFYSRMLHKKLLNASTVEEIWEILDTYKEDDLWQS